MAARSQTRLRLTVTILTVSVVAVLFYERAAYNLVHVDIRNSNFFVFWLAGKMVSTGQNPYDAGQWAAGHDTYGVTWRPNQTFLYPLPLAFLVAPLAWLPPPQAYFAWQLLSQIFIALVVWGLLVGRKEPRIRRLFLPLIVFLSFFGPVYLTLQIGSLGAFTLVAIGAAILALEQGWAFPAGLLLSLTMLKPSQGAPIALLAGIWLIARHEWKGLWGMFAGGVALLAVGAAADPLWMIQFGASSQTLLHETLGLQSNAISFAYLACRYNSSCTWLLGGLGSAAILALCGAYLWHARSVLTAAEAFSLIIPAAFVSTVYLWSYDQILYVIPIVWISIALLERTKSYVWPFLFVLGLVLVSLMALSRQATSHTDLWSLATTGLILVAWAALALRWPAAHRVP